MSGIGYDNLLCSGIIQRSTGVNIEQLQEIAHQAGSYPYLQLAITHAIVNGNDLSLVRAKPGIGYQLKVDKSMPIAVFCRVNPCVTKELGRTAEAA